MENEKEIQLNKRIEIMFHVHAMTGHERRDVILAHILKYAQWRGMKKDIMEFILKCSICRECRKERNKF